MDGSNGKAAPNGAPAESRSIAQIRRELVENRIALRNTDADLVLARAQAEQRAIDSAVAAAKAAGNGKEVDPDKALGSNEKARERALTLALAQDSGYQAVTEHLRGLQEKVDQLEAELEDARDRRREWEWHIRMRLADALDRRGVASDQVDPNGDHAFDDAPTEAVTDEMAREAWARTMATVEEGLRMMNGGDDEEESPF